MPVIGGVNVGVYEHVGTLESSVGKMKVPVVQ